MWEKRDLREEKKSTGVQERRKHCIGNAEIKQQHILRALNKYMQASWIDYPKEVLLTLVFLTFHSPSVTWNHTFLSHQCAVKINIKVFVGCSRNAALITIKKLLKEINTPVFK